MNVSVIVRIKDEVANFRKLLRILQQQTYSDFEIVVVNDHSSDGSDTVALEYFPPERVQVIHLKKPFSYAYASNVGAEAAKGNFLVYLSAHAFPCTTTWLADGLKRFANGRVAGVYAIPFAHTDTNVVEKLLVNAPAQLLSSRLKECTRVRMGMMGATNAIFRKDLWQQYPFSEDFVIGGEDTDWARHFLDKGYVIIHDPAFRVYHSHHLTLWPFIKQLHKYRKMLKPSSKNSAT